MSDFSKRFPDTVIRASAGTGKTFQLSNRYLGLLQCDQPPEQILASTFARKAAGEILERIMLRLAEAANSDAACASLESHLNCGELTRARCATLLEQLVKHLHQLRVGTLDSFFVQTAGNFALEFGLPGGWTILEDLDNRELRLESLRRLLRQRSESWDELTTLISLLQNGESARDVVDSLLTTIDDFYSLYLETSPQAWLGQPKLAMLPEIKLAEAVHDLEEAPLPSDKRFAKAHEKALGAARLEDWETFLTAGLAKAVADGSCTYYKKSLSPELIALYEPVVEHSRAHIVNRLIHQTEATYQLLDSYHQIYEPLKFRRRALRFEDITRILSINLTGAELSHVEFRLDASLHHLLLDEFQDTSLPQWNVIRLFADEVNLDPQKSFFCVGDVKQAIYGWRGGVSEIFDKVAGELRDIQQESMTKSRRSAPPIMDAVNRVFGAVDLSPALAEDDYEPVRTAWRERFETHQTVHTGYAGYCRLETFPVNDEGKTDKYLNSRFVAEKVAELHRTHPGCTIGVLTRTNQTVGRIIHYLRNPKAGTRDPVFASEEGGNPLTDSAAVIYILSLLKMAAHPGDLIARFNVAHSPLADVIEYRQYRNESLSLSIASRIRRLLLQDGYGRTIDRWVRLLALHCDRRELDRLMQLVELAWRYEVRASLNPLDFVLYVEETKVESPSSADVRVMTVHQSKGLQFDIVVLPELDGAIVSGRDKYIVRRERPTEPVSQVIRYFGQQLLPIVPPEYQAMHAEHRCRTINEALCLLYVALTRAVHALHIVIDPKTKPEALKSSAFIVNGLGDSDFEPESLICELGDEDWYEHEAARFALRQSVKLTSEQPPAKPIELAASRERRKRNLELVKPSQHAGEHVAMTELLQTENSIQRARGSLIHAWLEHITWLEDMLPDEEQFLKIGGQFARPGLDVSHELRWFRKRLDTDELQRELSLARYRGEVAPELFPELAAELADGRIELKVELERRVVFRTQTELVNGIVDRLVLYRREGTVIAADVIDYKTDSASNESAIKSLQKLYRRQLKIYGDAMRKLYQLEAPQVATRIGLISAPCFRRV